MVAVCRDQPFFSTDDWFIVTTPMSAGIPEATRHLTVQFSYNDLADLGCLFEAYPGQIAAEYGGCEVELLARAISMACAACATATGRCSSWTR